jgi:hypothetical protein
MPKLILRKIPTGPGELAHVIHDDEATKLVKAGKAVRLPDGVLREVVAPAKAKKAKKAATYKTKDMSAKG